MKLLILTQKIDKHDPILGFFHTWVRELSFEFEGINVVCLEKEEFGLPSNVKVFSLGKEQGKNRLQYIFQFFNLCFFQSLKYDAVFVHMNQEYVLLGGLFWKMLGKKVYMWRNHPQGSVATRLAVWLSKGVFCTSNYSFVARFRKTMLMPVGIDVEKFKSQNSNLSPVKNSILFIGRVSPIKNPDLLVEALKILKDKGVNFSCGFYGEALPKDHMYFDSLRVKSQEYGLESMVHFEKAVPNYKTPEIYKSYEIYVNLTPTGSFDKTVLEAAVSGCIPVVTNLSLKGEIDSKLVIEHGTPENIANAILEIQGLPYEEKQALRASLRKYVEEKHSLETLVSKLTNILKLS